MSRTIVLLAALALGAPATAATYSGKPASTASEARFVAKNIVWTLSGGQYQGRTEDSRPMLLCQSLAKRAGQLESFVVDGRPISGQDLAKCNAAARTAPQPVLADAN